MTQIDDLIDRLLALRARGEDPESSALWELAESECRDGPDMLLRFGAAVMSTDRTREGEALTYARRAVAGSPRDPVVLTRAASLLVAARELDEADELVRQAIDVAPADFPLAADLAHLAGYILFLHGPRDEAYEFLARAFEDDPGALGHGRVLAELYVEQGEPDRALDVIAEALEHGTDPRLAELKARIVDDAE
jgi:tetratricopeptide (TPR) repeat protein